MSRCSTVLLTTLALLGTACGEAIAPTPVDDYELPPADPSLDPARLTVGSYIATPCAFGIYGDRLDHLRNQDEWVLVDVYFGRDIGGGYGAPNSGEIDLVTNHGGRVLYRFNVPAVRARILLSDIPGLVQEGYWVSVRDVPDPTRYDVPGLSVGFDHAVREPEIELFRSLGGRIEYYLESINGISGVLPDRSVPALRDRAGVRYVDVSGVGCLA